MSWATPRHSHFLIKVTRQLHPTNTLVVPNGKLSHAMEIILAPIMHDMIEKKLK